MKEAIEDLNRFLQKRRGREKRKSDTGFYRGIILPDYKFEREGKDAKRSRERKGVTFESIK